MKEPIIRRIIFVRATQRSFKNCIILAGDDYVYCFDLFCSCIRTFRYIYIYTCTMVLFSSLVHALPMVKGIQPYPQKLGVVLLAMELLLKKFA